jgi:hypothetical protein
MTTDTRNGQSDVDILVATGIPLVLGARVWLVRPRTMKQDRAWLALVQERIARRIEGLDATQSVPGLIASLGEATDDMLDLILAYDTTGTLDREWIEENVYTPEITRAFTVLVEEAYPPFGIAREMGLKEAVMRFLRVMMEDSLGLKTPSPSPEPTSLPSTNGTSEAPKRSTRRSPIASSKS